jgi:hypothetical protein
MSNDWIDARILRPTRGGSAIKRLSQLALFAVLGQVLLLASAWFLPAVSEYGLIGDNISELALGRYGFVLTFAFVVSGLGVIGLSYAIRRSTVRSRGSLIGSLLIGVYGLGALVVAIFPTDRIDSPTDVLAQSTTGWIHSMTALISYLCAIVGMFILTWTFARHTRRRSLVVWSSLLAGAALALLFGQSEGPWVGLMQRLLITAISSWLILIAFRVRTIATTEQMTIGTKDGMRSAAG